MRTKPTPCPQCGFHYNCICELVPALSSEVRIELLMHKTEVARATNTGQLLEHALPYCRRHVWHRKAPPAELLTLLADPAAEPYLVFPDGSAISLESAVNRRTAKPEAKPLHFIIIDATWQQARKMLRKSPWLSDVPTVSLPDNLTTTYQLRRNQPEGGLCTCEVGILLLEAMHEPGNARALTNYFHQFMAVFEADRQHQSLSQ